MIIIKIAIASLFLSVSLSTVAGAQILNQTSKNTHHLNYVPNAETAKKIAEAIWLPIYGNEIYNDTPYVATLKNGSLWIVRGSFHGLGFGGVPWIEIRKNDCKVLLVTHGK